MIESASEVIVALRFLDFVANSIGGWRTMGGGRLGGGVAEEGGGCL